MTSQVRQELLNLIELLCEDRLSPTQGERLQELVLADRECRRLYVQAMELNGLLYWDAGGVGSLHEMPVRKSVTPLRRRAVNWPVALGGLALLLILGTTFLRKPQPHLAEQAQPHGSVEQPFSGHEPEIPQISLPPVQQPPEQQIAAADKTNPSPAAAQLTFEPTGDLIALINAQIRKGWTDAEIQPAPRASDSEWVRRVYLDLAGRIPTVAETRKFLEDTSETRHERLVTTLLKSPDFARHEATIWTNLLVGRAENRKINRDALLSWLTDAFRRNQPWDDTLSQLLTAQGPAEEGPTNFLLAHLNNQAVPATSVTARIFLCQQLQCAQCHQHPVVKEWGQEQFWKFNAFFQQTRIRETSQPGSQPGRMSSTRELVNQEKFGPTFYETLQGVMQVAYPEFAGKEITKAPEQPLRDQLAELLGEDGSHQLAKAFINRTWAQIFGYGFTHPVDDMGPHNPPSHPELLDALAKEFVSNGYSVQKLMYSICLSEPYLLSSRVTDENPVDAPEQGERPYFSRMYVKPMTAEQLFDSLVIASGTSPQRLNSRQGPGLRREDWAKQFFAALETEENSESTTLDGSLPQVLMMMNGDLIQRAVSPESGQYLNSVLNKQGATETQKINELSLAALSRPATPDEVNRIRKLVRLHVKQRTEKNVPAPVAVQEALRDVYWAYLNSSEFSVNR
ncbi:DUF1549 domain-containing protein [Planctomicrobium sp. SH664]|uniref:DUF1549 domain-containing protein n=1 Tax=Planctomicrobium sp. SH664 TaxID=3448125 RepID=UPI003F5B72C3